MAGSAILPSIKGESSVSAPMLEGSGSNPEDNLGRINGDQAIDTMTRIRPKIIADRMNVLDFLDTMLPNKVIFIKNK